MERLILMVTDEGDVVLDPFIGTGTTAIAAKRLEREYVGIDIDSKYVEMSKKKLQSVAHTMISDCYVSVFLDRIITIRDKDYEKIRGFLKRDKIAINRRKSKQLTLPYLS